MNLSASPVGFDSAFQAQGELNKARIDALIAQATKPSYTPAPYVPEEPLSYAGGQYHEQSVTVREIGALVRWRAQATRRATFQALAEWEGCVDQLTSDTFRARLVPVGAPNPSTETVAEFEKRELGDSDLELLRVGAIFRWVIGYSRLRGGTKRRESSVVFRRLPAWREKEIAEAVSKADEILSALVIE